MRLYQKIKLFAVCLMAVYLLTGCADRGMHDLKGYVDEVKSRKAGHIEPLPEIKPIETFAYISDGRRSPFVAQDQNEESGGQAEGVGLSPDFNRRKEELESYPLDSLRMVGLLEQLGVTWALVQTQERTIHRVRTGNYLGTNHGQITQISETQIELTEIIPDGQGGYRERQASLALAGE
ncbi:MAG: pilus assembly protein PilP [Sedimenticola thiotaurini]|uniref:Pilus assembly protein PilP n=1 Tax=Sedimenticola thiotaurini TaxID=1543721 RepID=A0A558DFE3_9GAMM|nr:MAG: pilus assembly protein PilP [Sedimenticola thiotaurini]